MNPLILLAVVLLLLMVISFVFTFNNAFEVKERAFYLVVGLVMFSVAYLILMNVGVFR